MEFSSPELKKFLIFFLYFGRELSELEKQRKPTLKKFLISPPPLKNFFLIFQEGTSFPLKIKTLHFFLPKKFLIFQEMELSSPQLKKLDIFSKKILLFQEGTFRA